MPVYEEKEKVNGQKRYYIRTYVTDEFGKRKQITRHNKTWIGRDGYWLAYQEESMLKSKKINKHENITLKELYNEYLNHKKPMLKLSTYLKYKDDIENLNKLKKGLQKLKLDKYGKTKAANIRWLIVDIENILKKLRI